MQGGTFLRLLLFITTFAILTGLCIPLLLENLLQVDDNKIQKRAESIVVDAAKWYLMHNGIPNETMYTDDVKKALIPEYLNKWPGKYPIVCTIDTQGNIIVETVEPEKIKPAWLAWLLGDP
ncbi:hypothetical protein J2Z37_001615 [Ammoniphilus resinae]|uniref:Uncharacterized protein n=2 Tax=Ammoniphilus resinae TaxID=861532 RepID=A0ABS4GMZ5_9BACL|nr:hypothetical protein [Ammoniphilus resinae]